MDIKMCKKCGVEKPIDEFSKDSSRKDGKHPYCKQCKYEVTKTWTKNNWNHVLEKIKANKKRYWRDPEKKERLKAAYKAWCETDRGKELLREKCRRQRKTEGWKKIQKRATEKYLSNPENREKHSARSLVRRRLGKPSFCVLANPDCYGAFQWHHHKGYAKEHWLDVVSVCVGHHKLLDNGKIKIGVPFQDVGHS